MTIDEIMVVTTLAVGVVVIVLGLVMYKRHARRADEARIKEQWQRDEEQAKRARENISAQLERIKRLEEDEQLSRRREALKVADLYRNSTSKGNVPLSTPAVASGGGGTGGAVSQVGTVPQNVAAISPYQNTYPSMLSGVADVAMIANTLRHWNDTDSSRSRREVDRTPEPESPRYESSSASLSNNDDDSTSRSSYSSPSYSDDSSSSYSSSDSGSSPSYD